MEQEQHGGGATGAKGEEEGGGGGATGGGGGRRDGSVEQEVETRPEGGEAEETARAAGAAG